MTYRIAATCICVAVVACGGRHRASGPAATVKTVATTPVPPFTAAVPVPEQPATELGSDDHLKGPVAHSRRGFAYLVRARGTPKEHKDWRTSMIVARDEYRRADKEWTEAAAEDRPAKIAYETRFWIADARFNTIEIQRALGEPFASWAIEPAISAALLARDAPLGVAFRRVPAARVVDLTQWLADEARRAFVAGDCKSPPAPKVVRVIPPSSNYGVPTAVTTTTDASPLSGEPKSSATVIAPTAVADIGLASEHDAACDPKADEKTWTRVWRRDVPPIVLRSVRACEELIDRVPASHDLDRVLRCRAQIAQTLLAYGHLADAAMRFEAIRGEACGIHRAGVDASMGLSVVAAATGDFKLTYRLQSEYKKQPCSIDIETYNKECLLGGALHCEYGPQAARWAYSDAMKASDPKERIERFRKAAAIYRYLLTNLHVTRAEYAANLAYAAEQAGDHDGERYGLAYIREHFCAEQRLKHPEPDDPSNLAEICAESAFKLGKLYLDVDGLDGLLDVYRLERAVTWFRACKSGVAKGACPPLVDAELSRATKAHAAAVATDVLP